MAQLIVVGGRSPQAGDFQAIGRFVLACSELEGALHSLLRHLLRIDDKVIRLLVGQARIGDLISHLKNAFDHQQDFGRTDEMRDALNKLYDRVSYVYRVRSIVAHRPALRFAEDIVFHDYNTAKKLSAATGYRCTADQLNRCTEYVSDLAEAILAVVDLGSRDPAMYTQYCHALAASPDKRDLPIDPQSMNQKTAKPRRPPRSSRE